MRGKTLLETDRKYFMHFAVQLMAASNITWAINFIVNFQQPLHVGASVAVANEGKCCRKRMAVRHEPLNIDDNDDDDDDDDEMTTKLTQHR